MLFGWRCRIPTSARRTLQIFRTADLLWNLLCKTTPDLTFENFSKASSLDYQKSAFESCLKWWIFPLKSQHSCYIYYINQHQITCENFSKASSLVVLELFKIVWKRQLTCYIHYTKQKYSEQQHSWILRMTTIIFRRKWKQILASHPAWIFFWKARWLLYFLYKPLLMTVFREICTTAQVQAAFSVKTWW